MCCENATRKTVVVIPFRDPKDLAFEALCSPQRAPQDELDGHHGPHIRRYDTLMLAQGSVPFEVLRAAAISVRLFLKSKPWFSTSGNKMSTF
jgi:hypothetical protein